MFNNSLSKIIILNLIIPFLFYWDVSCNEHRSRQRIEKKPVPCKPNILYTAIILNDPTAEMLKTI